MAVLDDFSQSMEYLPLKEFPTLKRPGLASCYYDWLEHPSEDEYWDRWSIEKRYNRVHAAAFNLGGWYDIFVGGTLKNFTGMQQQGPNSQIRKGQKLLVGPWIHHAYIPAKSGQVAPGFSAGRPTADIDGLILRWFDYWLKEEANGILEEPPIRIFVMGANL